MASGNGGKQNNRIGPGRLVMLAVCVVVFGVLMGMRQEFGSLWTRALIAGLAGGILSLGSFILISQRKSH